MPNAWVYPDPIDTCRFGGMTNADAHRELHALSDLLAARRKTVEEQAVALADMLTDAASREGVISEYSTEIDRLRARLDQAARQVDSLNKSIDRQARAIFALEGDKEALKDERTNLRKSADRTNNLLDAKRQELVDVYAERNKLRQEVAELRAKAEPQPLADWERELFAGVPDIGWTVVELSNRPRYQVQRHVYYVTLTTDGEINPETVATAKSMAEMTAGQHYVDKVNKGYDGPIHYTSSLPTYNTLPERGVTFVITLTLK